MRISVALCSYNGAAFIKEQLLSILNQELNVDEIVAIDDDSTDDTLSIIHSIAAEYPGVLWNIQKNSQRLGVKKNFERALFCCQGDFIFLSDQDDIWAPNKTRTIIDYFNGHTEVNLVYTNAELIDQNGYSISKKTLFDLSGLYDVLDAWEAGMQFEIENVIQRLLGATFGIRKQYLLKCLPFIDSINNYHDGILAMHSVVDECSGRIDECLIKYRIHSNNVIGLGGNACGRLSGKVMHAWSDLIEPREVNPFFLLPCASPITPRVRFYLKRKKNYARLSGKICLAGAILEYIKYYRRFWFRFYASDLLYGVSERLRQHMVHGW